MKQLSIALLCLLLAVSCSAPEKKTPETTPETEQPTTETEPKAVELAVSEVSYTVEGTELQGYITYNKNQTGKRPGILVVHEWWGHDEYARKRADMLAEMGYVAFALDMYGDGKKAEHPQDAQKFVGEVLANIDGATARFNAAIAQLKANPNVDPEKIGAIGYCFGGSVALAMANAGIDLDAVAAFHSGVQLPIMPEAGKLKAKVLVCNGADDTFIPAETVTAFKAAMDEVGADYKYIAYEGAKHSFTSPAATARGKEFNLPLEYNEAADKASWQELQAMLTNAFK